MKGKFLLKLSLIVCALSCSFYSQAQYVLLLAPQFLVDSPLTIAGQKPFVASNQGSSASLPADNWGRAIDSAWVDLPLIKPEDSTACSGITGSMAGHFALIYRANCMFSYKAYLAQQAGALGVIIVNNVPGEINFTMAPGDSATAVHIPCIIIPKEQGDSINAMMNSGTEVDVTLTIWGSLKNNDLDLFGKVAVPPYTAIPLSQMGTDNGNPIPYHFYTGGLIANTGNQTETNVKLVSDVTFAPTTGAATSIYSDTLGATSFPTLDSIIQLISATSHDVNATTTGVFNMTYSVSSDSVDQVPFNNTYIATMNVTNNTFCAAPYDAVKNAPIVSIAYGGGSGLPSGVSSFTWGPMFYVAKSGYQAINAKLALDDNDTSKHNLSNLSGQEILVLYKWIDGNQNGIIEEPELSVSGFANVPFGVTDSNFTVVTSDTFTTIDPVNPQPVYMSGGAYYWVAAVTPKADFLGASNGVNYYCRGLAAETQATPELNIWGPEVPDGVDLGGTFMFLNSADTVRSFPFTTGANSFKPIDSIGVSSAGIVPAISFNIGTVANTTATPAVKHLASSLSMYPNPATDNVTIAVSYLNQAPTMSLIIMNGLGQVVYRELKNNVSSFTETISTSKFAAGNYLVVVTDGHNSNTQKLTIVK